MVLTLALICLMTAVIIPGVMGIGAAPVVTVTSSDNPSVYSHPVTFTATVSGSGGAADENVTFEDNGVPWFGSSNVSLNATTGAADITKTDFTVGIHNITAWYFGNSSMLANMSFIDPQTVTDGNGASPVNLGLAGNYAVLAETGISNAGAAGTLITGNIGISPYAASSITGFGALPLDPSGRFSTTPLVTGKVYAADYTPPTPSRLTTAVTNMMTAYTVAGGRPNPDATELYGGDPGGKNLTPGIYKWSTGVLIPTATDLILDAQGNSSAVWIFQLEGDLTMDSGSRIVLINSAKPENVFWHIAGPTGVTLNSGAHAEGNLLTAKGITMTSGASINGRALAQTAVTLISNPITAPGKGAVASSSMVGVFRNTTGSFILKNGTERTVVILGQNNDLPVSGDWNGDGLTEVGVYRPSSAKFILNNGTERTVVPWGRSGDLPVTGKWS